MPASAPAFYHDVDNLALRDLIDAAGNVIPSAGLGESHQTFLFQIPPAVERLRIWRHSGPVPPGWRSILTLSPIRR